MFVVNGATPRARITSEAVIALTQHGTLAPVILHQRTGYAASMIDGRTVMEIPGDERSAEEIPHALDLYRRPARPGRGATAGAARAARRRGQRMRSVAASLETLGPRERPQAAAMPAKEGDLSAMLVLDETPQAESWRDKTLGAARKAAARFLRGMGRRD